MSAGGLSARSVARRPSAASVTVTRQPAGVRSASTGVATGPGASERPALYGFPRRRSASASPLSANQTNSAANPITITPAMAIHKTTVIFMTLL
jgi:hypothetical protein